MRLSLLAGLATLLIAAFVQPAEAARPIKGVVHGTATAAKGIGHGAVQAGRGIVHGTVIAARGVGHGLRCVVTLGNRC